MAVEPFLGSRAQRAFIGTIIIQALIVLVMVAITFRLVEDKVEFKVARYKTLPCYLALFALAEVFEMYIALDALRLRNIIELLGVLAFHLGLVVAAALQVHETKVALVQQTGCDASVNAITCDGAGTLWSSVYPFLIVSPCVIGASWILMCYFVKELYAEFGWAIFHVVGANPKMKDMYRYYQILLCLLKFDFFSFTGVTMQLLIVVLQRSSAEFGLTIAAIPVVLVLIILCRFAVQREIRWIMIMSLVLMLASLVYFYKLVKFYEPGSRDVYLSTRATLTVFTIVAFLLLSASFAIGLKCYLDFDQGLVESKVNNIPKRLGHSRRPSSKVENMSQDYQAACFMISLYIHTYIYGLIVNNITDTVILMNYDGVTANFPELSMVSIQKPWWLVFLDRTNIFIPVLTASVICGTRSAAATYTALGSVICVASVKLVKNLFKQRRPQHEGTRLKSTYGMPSTHSTAISYYATYIVLACLRLPIHPSFPSGTATRVIPPITAVPWALLVVMSRVWLGHHTWPQVIVGASYGVAFASVWFFYG